MLLLTTGKDAVKMFLPESAESAESASLPVYRIDVETEILDLEVLRGLDGFSAALSRSKIECFRVSRMKHVIEYGLAVGVGGLMRLVAAPHASRLRSGGGKPRLRARRPPP